MVGLKVVNLMAVSTEAPMIGRRYILNRPLGHGGMGAVYHATDRLTGMPVALKRVTPPNETSQTASTSDSQDYRIALAGEFKVLSSLRHPNIISVIDYGFDDQRQPYYTMELVENAQTIIEAGSDRPLVEQVKLLVQMLQALAYLHRRGVIHRDLKPRNVLVTGGQVKVLDFGLSVMAEQAGVGVGSTAGTLAYMAPEVLAGGQASEAADLYAVGVIAYELFAGKHPFDSEDVGTLLNNVLYVPPDMDLLSIDTQLRLVLERLLAKSRESRYRTANEVLAELSEAIDQPLPLETAATRESFLQAARLIGRDEEVSKLTDAMDEAAAGKGSAWLIGGESGVGKSRLIEELRAQAMVRGALVLRGQGVSEGGMPYHLWHSPLRWLALLCELDDTKLGILKSLLPDLDSVLGREIAEASELDVKAAQNRLLTVIEDMFRQQKGTVVVILEDLHWANESLDVLKRVNQIVAELPLLIIGSYRDDERPELPSGLPGMNVLKLDRLNEEGIAQLSEAMLGDAGKQPQVVELLQRETEGNVFFLVEVVRVLAEEAGTLERIGMVTLPAQVFVGGVQRIIQRRLSHIPPESLPLLQLAAVLGRYLDLDVLRYLEPDINLDLWLNTCSDAAVLEVQEGEWRFAHDKLRDGVLEGLAPETRRELHGRIGIAMERLHPNDPALYTLLAFHYGQAGNEARETQYAELGGRQALRTGAYRDAIALFERALLLVLKRQTGRINQIKLRQIELKRQIADARLGLGEYTLARTLYRENLNDAWSLKDNRSTADALMSLGDVSAALNEYPEARQYYQESLTLYRGLDLPPLVARVLNSLGSVAYETGAEDEARKLFQESLTLAREAGSGWGMAGSMQGAGSGGSGQLAEAQTAFQTALSHYHDKKDRDALIAAFQKFQQVIETEEVFEIPKKVYQDALDAFEKKEDEWGAGLSLAYLGRLAIVADDLSGARGNLLNALKIARDANEIPLALDILAAVGQLLIKTDRKSLAVETLALALHHAESAEYTQDEAERLLFGLEDQLDASVMSASWEQGKTRTFAEAVSNLLATL